MAQKSERMSKRDRKRNGEQIVSQIEVLREPKRVVALEPKTEAQRRYMNAIRNFTLTFGLGPAGTGKTYIAGALAAQALLEKRTDKIIITRPAVDAGESLGYLPGELEQKYEPYIAPFCDVLNERLGKSHVENLLKNGRIEAAPLAYMRGRTFKNAYVILDEAQNTTPAQMKLFLTRIGESCHVVVNGDETQIDVRGLNGLTDAVRRLHSLSSVRVVKFEVSDIVRSGLVQEIVEAYGTNTDVRMVA